MEEAADGRQAFRRARAGGVDLVITDLIIPEQERIETIQTLVREMPGIGIIAISGDFGAQFLQIARLMGADAVLNKPLAVDTLLPAVATVLSRRKQRS